MNSKRNKQSKQRYFEQNFNLKRILKRNKQFLDVQLINSLQKSSTRKRRIPFEKCSLHITDKISDSFLNSTQAYSFKIQNTTPKKILRVVNNSVGKRVQTQPVQACNIQQNNNEQVVIEDKKKSQVWSKMLSRAQTSKDNKRVYTQNQQRFNNFYLTSPQYDRTRSFQKYPPRFQTAPSSTNNANYTIDPDKVVRAQLDTKYFRTSTPWNYKNQKWDRGPIYADKIQKHNSINLANLPDQRVKKAKKKVIPKWDNKMMNFKKVTSKQVPSHFQIIYHTPNCNYRQRKHLIKHKAQSKDIRVLQKKQFIEFDRDQVCDVFFFRRETLKNNKKNTKLYTQ